MPTIYDNIDTKLLNGLLAAGQAAYRGDFCVGYFNLRGWRHLAPLVEAWPAGEEPGCRVLVGMQRLPQEEIRLAKSIAQHEDGIDNQQALRLKQKLAQEFRDQLTIGAPTAADETALRQLANQIRAGKVVVKLFLRHPLHAKLYLLHREDTVTPVVGYLGSSNLTLAGLSEQGELNIDVLDADACQKLLGWFNDRWEDKWCVDISQDLVAVIDESWAREALIPPYHIYVKMAYHLCQEAREGLSEFSIPRDFGDRLFDFQKKAVQIAAHHLHRRGGVLIGDVVGLGKTLMATALARIFEDDLDLETLIICPKNLVKMWEDYRETYRLRGRVLSISLATRELPNLRRYRLIILDESHNLRNREGKVYRAIQEYIRENDSRVILLSATPYNKSYLDLSNQLRLFVPEDVDLGLRPERLLQDLGEVEFVRRHQCPVRSLAAFEKSEYPDDWRELMRRYLVRRTRTFIKDNYAETGPDGRQYLPMPDGTPMYFPARVPRKVPVSIDESNPHDQYARLYADPVVHAVNDLRLPRYGLGNYVHEPWPPNLTSEEEKTLQGLSRAGKRLMGFCRTNLFKRLESSGHSFLLSVERHILRNFVYLHALEQGLPVPIGTQDVAILDTRHTDEDADAEDATGRLPDDSEDWEDNGRALGEAPLLWSEEDFRRRAEVVYAEYCGSFRNRFKWLAASLFDSQLSDDLKADSAALMAMLRHAGRWDPSQDAQLDALERLLTQTHPDAKVLIFSQFADTVHYLSEQLTARGVTAVAGVTGAADDPTALAWRFSPISNGRPAGPDELRVLIATDVLSEGQNLQDCSIVVNYDLPWAIIRLIQRAGRVDRIGQTAAEVLCYSFLPVEGVERIIRLRARVRTRLHENGEVVGSDEAFFEDDQDNKSLVDLYHEKAGSLDDDNDSEVDLASEAYQIWRNAIDADPDLEAVIKHLPPVVNSTRSHLAGDRRPDGVLVYVRTTDDNDVLAWVDQHGECITTSQRAILAAARCQPGTPALPRRDHHHALVQQATASLLQDERLIGGGLGRPSGARFRTYERLKRLAESIKGTLLEREFDELPKAIEEIYRFPLRQGATDKLNRQLRAGIDDEALARRCLELREVNDFCLVHDDDDESAPEPRIICSLGLTSDEG